MTEIVYVVQPIENENYKTLHAEIIALIESAGAEYAGTIYQNIREINPATYIGEGKLAELNERLRGLDLTVLFNGNLSPSQTLNISAALGGKKVIDRTTLILDIFALRAQSSEGKIQVELAQLKYLYPRLKGKGEALSRLGGGIGTRGPGETKLEIDRRHIRTRIHALESKLDETAKRRSMQTQRRKKERVKTVALVGYTNTGKSTLLNAITGADVLTKNALFATLDPTARAFELESVPFLLIDTVGFLQDLPHNLIEAFRTTRESAVNFDLALIVCDGTGEHEMQLQTTLSTLHDMGFHAPYLVVLNKNDSENFTSEIPKNALSVSAKTGNGLDNLKQAIFQALKDEFICTQLFVPYSDLSVYNELKNYLTEREIVYTDFGVKISAVIPMIYAEKFRRFLNKKSDRYAAVS